MPMDAERAGVASRADQAGTRNASTSTRVPMGIQDALWLEMDRPTNLMVVDSLVWTAEPLDWERFETVARQRLWDRYPVFRSIAVHDEGHWFWEELATDSFEAHLTRLRLPDPGGDRELQQFVASQRTVPLDRSRPLWQMFCVDGFRGGSAVLTRMHHAIADGIRMVQLAMSLFDATPDGGAILPPASPGETRPAVPGPAGPHLDTLARDALHTAGRVGDAIGKGFADPAAVVRAGVEAVGGVVGGAVGGVSSAAASLGRRSLELGAASLSNPVGAAHGATVSAAAWLQHALRPPPSGTAPVFDVLAAGSSDVDVVRKLLLGTRNDPTIWTGRAGTRKEVAWSEPIALDAVKAVARARTATVNDVLVTCVAGALHRYLAGRDAHCDSVNWMIPVNLKPIDVTLPERLGNEFAIVQLELPTGDPDPLAVLEVVKQRMSRIKHGHEAAIAFRLQELVSGLSEAVYRATVDLLANRAVGVLTNVPGPPMPVHLAGVRVDGMVGWAPLSGDQPMSFTIYSYDAKVFVGIACDAELVPDHEQIVDGFAATFRHLQDVVADR